MYIVCLKIKLIYTLGGVFLENKQFFDPYNFNSMLTQPIQNSNQYTESNQFNQMPCPSPTMFYEQQYWYYNYLTKMLEYKINLKEYENMNKKSS